MDHLDKMPGAVGSAIEETLFGGAIAVLPPRCARRGVNAGSEAGKDRDKMTHDLLFTADHQTVPAFESGGPAACSDIHIVDSFLLQLGAPSHVIAIIGVASVNHDISRFEERGKHRQFLVHYSCRQHEPNGTRFREPCNKLFQRICSYCTLRR